MFEQESQGQNCFHVFIFRPHNKLIFLYTHQRFIHAVPLLLYQELIIKTPYIYISYVRVFESTDSFQQYLSN